MGNSEPISQRFYDTGDARIGQILNDYLDRKAAGDPVCEVDLLARHPELADELRAHLNLLRDIEPTHTAVTQLLDRGILASSTDGRYAAELGPFRILDVVGRGGMGVVLKAYDADLNRLVALKLLRTDLAGDRKALARFVREAKAAAALQHPNIITVYAVGEERGTPYIVMEFVDGCTLAQRIREDGPLPTRIVRQIFRQLLSGLAAAHEVGLIHRDIKPSNILLSGDEPHVKIADFGLARVLSGETRMTLTGSVFGTPEYMSPEQARGDDDVDHRTDLYSAGVMLYEMLTGRPPFKAESGSAVIHQILYDEPPDPRAILRSADVHLSSLALRLMARDPGDRFQSAAEALAAHESTGRITLPAMRRRRARRLAWGVPSLIVAAGMLTAVWRLGRDSVVPVTTPDSKTLREVGVEVRDGEKSHTLIARYGDSMEWKEFYSFPLSVVSVLDATLIDVDGRGDRVVVAAIPMPWDANCLFGFNLDATFRWRLDMSDTKQWPDSGALNAWQAKCVTAVDADGRPGDEIIAAAGDNAFYAARLSLIEPHTGAIEATFWHPGQFHGIEVLPDYFGEGHPAIFAWGVNNKLDGFGDDPARPYVPTAGEDLPVTEYNIVPVAMILDPRSLDGTAPPKAPQLPHNEADGGPAAYAFVDVPATSHATYVHPTSGRRRDPERGMISEIDGATLVRCPANAEGPCLQVGVRRSNNPSGALVVVDRRLAALSVERAGPKEAGIDGNWWLTRWRNLVRAAPYTSD